MKTRLIVFIFLLLVGAFASTPTSALTSKEAARKLEAMTWYTEEYPPYNYKGDDGLPTGMSVDILMAAFKKIGVRLTPGDIKIVPWKGAADGCGGPGSRSYSPGYYDART